MWNLLSYWKATNIKTSKLGSMQLKSWILVTLICSLHYFIFITNQGWESLWYLLEASFDSNLGRVKHFDFSRSVSISLKLVKRDMKSFLFQTMQLGCILQVTLSTTIGRMQPYWLLVTLDPLSKTSFKKKSNVLDKI